MARWDSSSSSKSRSGPRGRRKALHRASKYCTRVSIVSAPRRELQQASDDARNPLPVLGFGGQLLLSGGGNGVKLGFSIVLRRAPSGPNPPFLHQAHQAKIDGSLVHQQGVLAQLLNAPRD